MAYMTRDLGIETKRRAALRRMAKPKARKPAVRKVAEQPKPRRAGAVYLKP